MIRLKQILLESKCLTLYHSTTRPIVGVFNMRGRNGYGAYFAKKKKDSKVFGDLTYKVKICPKNTLILKDNEVGKHRFFNIDKEAFDVYLEKGYDSLSWFRGGEMKEFVVLDPKIIIDYFLET